jgi:hypothetical protein
MRRKCEDWVFPTLPRQVSEHLLIVSLLSEAEWQQPAQLQPRQQQLNHMPCLWGRCSRLGGRLLGR